MHVRVCKTGNDKFFEADKTFDGVGHEPLRFWLVDDEALEGSREVGRELENEKEVLIEILGLQFEEAAKLQSVVDGTGNWIFFRWLRVFDEFCETLGFEEELEEFFLFDPPTSEIFLDDIWTEGGIQECGR